jgi:hypothetical protein
MTQCLGITLLKKQCLNIAKYNGYCHLHKVVVDVRPTPNPTHIKREKDKFIEMERKERYDKKWLEKKDVKNRGLTKVEKDVMCAKLGEFEGTSTSSFLQRLFQVRGILIELVEHLSLSDIVTCMLLSKFYFKQIYMISHIFDDVMYGVWFIGLKWIKTKTSHLRSGKLLTYICECASKGYDKSIQHIIRLSIHTHIELRLQSIINNILEGATQGGNLHIIKKYSLKTTSLFAYIEALKQNDKWLIHYYEEEIKKNTFTLKGADVLEVAILKKDLTLLEEYMTLTYPVLQLITHPIHPPPIFIHYQYHYGDCFTSLFNTEWKEGIVWLITAIEKSVQFMNKTTSEKFNDFLKDIFITHTNLYKTSPTLISFINAQIE